MILSHRHLGIALDMLLKLVKSFGPLIHSAISAAPLVGVDLEAEQRYLVLLSSILNLFSASHYFFYSMLGWRGVIYASLSWKN